MIKAKSEVEGEKRERKRVGTSDFEMMGKKRKIGRVRRSDEKERKVKYVCLLYVPITCKNFFYLTK